MILTCENRSTGRQTCLIAMLYITNPSQAGLGLNLDPHGDRLGSNILSHGMAARLLEHMKRSGSVLFEI
jgi:hypothetical protein